MANILEWPLDKNRIRSTPDDGMQCVWGGTYGWVRTHGAGTEKGKRYGSATTSSGAPNPNFVSAAKRTGHRAEIGTGAPVTPVPPGQGAEASDVHNWPHQGWDFVAPSGTPVYASADGQVKLAGTHAGEYGKWLLVQYGEWFVFYAHLNDNSIVSGGDSVALGQVIAKTGITGNAVLAHAHLHLELRDNGVVGIPPTTNPRNPFYMRKDPREAFGNPPFSEVIRVPPVQAQSAPQTP
jgi:murein DD-endopeptidase MepM/ murein hydrolase activator NlpD